MLTASPCYIFTYMCWARMFGSIYYKPISRFNLLKSSSTFKSLSSFLSVRFFVLRSLAFPDEPVIRRWGGSTAVPIGWDESVLSSFEIHICGGSGGLILSVNVEDTLCSWGVVVALVLLLDRRPNEPKLSLFQEEEEEDSFLSDDTESSLDATVLKVEFDELVRNVVDLGSSSWG